jgi:hypothetical protein
MTEVRAVGAEREVALLGEHAAQADDRGAAKRVPVKRFVVAERRSAMAAGNTPPGT